MNSLHESRRIESIEIVSHVSPIVDVDKVEGVEPHTCAGFINDFGLSEGVEEFVLEVGQIEFRLLETSILNVPVAIPKVLEVRHS